MVHFIILNCKDSSRFPGKNARLLKYTLDFVVKERELLPGSQIWYVSDTDKKLDIPDYHHLVLQKNEMSHLEVIRWTQNQISPADDDKMVLLQLTQPVRRTRISCRGRSNTRYG